MTSSDLSKAPTAETLREIMSNWAAGVTIVTCRSQNQVYGLTVSSFTSVSLEPPLVLVCIAGEAKRSGIMQAAGGFTVNLLRLGAEPIANQFAVREGDRFAGVQTHDPIFASAGPVLPEVCHAYLECRTIQSVDAGDHTVFVGRVMEAVRLSDDPPLLYWRRSYTQAVALDNSD